MKIAMKSPIHGFDVVMNQDCGDGYVALLLSNGTDYAACRVSFARQLAAAENYSSPTPGLLAAPLTRSGLEDLLQWTDRVTAIVRYRALVAVALKDTPHGSQTNEVLVSNPYITLVPTQ